MEIPVKTISDLHNEIIRLEKLKQHQEIALKQRLSSPSSIFQAAMSLFPKSPDSPKGSSIFNQDIVGLLSRIAIPFTLNKTLFKGSGFIVKTLVGLLSQKASNYISEDSVVGVWDKAKSMFGGVIEKITGKNTKAEANASHVTSAVL